MTDAVAADQTLPAPDTPPAAAGPIEARAEGSSAPHAVSPEAGAATAEPPEPPAFDPRLLVSESLGAVRRSILDALMDAEGETLTVSELIAQMPPGTSRNVAESSIHRELTAGRIERVSAGTYRLAPFKPPAPPEPSSPGAVKVIEMLAGFAWQSDPAALAGLSEEAWFDALEAWYTDASTWDPSRFGPPPNHSDNRVPYDIMRRWRDRIERAREAEARAALQREADDKLRDELLAVANGNYMLGLGLTDLAPVKAILETVSVDDLLQVIRAKHDRRIFPGNPPLVSWRDPIFLKAVAEYVCRRLAKNMVATWSAAGNAPQTPVETPDVSAAVP